MNKNLPILTPTSSTDPTPQPHNRGDNKTPSPDVTLRPHTPTDAYPPEQTPTRQQSARITPTVPPPPDIGFEISLGPITLTNLDLSNSHHIELLASSVSIILSAYLYRRRIRLLKHKNDTCAFQKAESTFGARIDKLHENNIIITPPKKLGFWESVLNPRAKRHFEEQSRVYERIIQELHLIRQEIHDFQSEYRGAIDEGLEDSIQYLYEVTSIKPPNIDAIISALERIRIVAERLDLGQETLHMANSVIAQLKKAS